MDSKTYENSNHVSVFENSLLSKSPWGPVRVSFGTFAGTYAYTYTGSDGSTPGILGPLEEFLYQKKRKLFSHHKTCHINSLYLILPILLVIINTIHSQS